MTRLTSFMIMDLIVKSKVSKKLELNNTTKLVLIGLASHYNNKKHISFPSQTLLSEELDISESSVIRAIKELRNKNVVVSASHTGTNNIYKFTELFFNLILSGDTEKNNPCHDDSSTPVTMTVNPCHHDRLTNKKPINITMGLKNSNDFDRELNAQLSNARITETKQYLEESLKMNQKTGSPFEFVEKITPHQAKVLLDGLPRELCKTDYYKALEEKARQLTFAEVS